MKKMLYIFSGLMFLGLISCKKDTTDLSPQLTGLWKQEQVFIDDVPQTLSAGELNTSLLLEENGVYRLFDGEKNQQHPGTWLVSDEDWLNLSMDKIQGINKDSTYRFGQVLVRFTVLKVDAEHLELRIKTFLYERKQTVMFNLMKQDNTTGMTGEEKLALDTKNKELHTYRYVFKKSNL